MNRKHVATLAIHAPLPVLTPSASLGDFCFLEKEVAKLSPSLSRTIQFHDVTGSGSGASFFTCKDAGAEASDAYLIKAAMLDSPAARVREEIKAYHILQESYSDLPYLRPVKMEELPYPYLILPFLTGQSTSELVRRNISEREYSDIFNQGIGVLLARYQRTAELCINPLLWFSERTIGHGMSPVAKLDTSLLDFRAERLVFNGLCIPNGLSFFSELGATASHLEFSWILSPRYLSVIPTDPNTLNEMVLMTGSGNRVNWIDPGRVELAQLVYPLIKHDGPFAHLLPYILNHELQVTSGEGCTVLLSRMDVDGFESSKKLHSMTAVMSRLADHVSGGELLRERPFFKVHFLFFTFRQFLRDMAYAIANNDKDRAVVDLSFFSLGMKVVSPILDAIVSNIKAQFPGEDFEAIVRDPSNKDSLRDISDKAYQNRMQDGTPEIRLYQKWFGV